MPQTLYDFEALQTDGSSVPLSNYRGQVLLIVNTASACGFTPQFAGLEALHEQYGARGLVVLGFPCNQFGSQDPGSNEEIASFCQLNYGVSFPARCTAGWPPRRQGCWEARRSNGTSPSFWWGATAR